MPHRWSWAARQDSRLWRQPPSPPTSPGTYCRASSLVLSSVCSSSPPQSPPSACCRATAFKFPAFQVAGFLGACAQSPYLSGKISEWVHLAEILLVLPIGSVETERTFSAMNYLKNNLRSSLKEPHLNACVRAFCSGHKLATFPLDAVLQEFLVAKSRRMLDAVA